METTVNYANTTSLQANAPSLGGTQLKQDVQPPNLSQLLNEAYSNLAQLNERLAQLHAAIRGPQLETQEGKVPVSGPLGVLNLSQQIQQATINALDKLNNIQQLV